MTPKTVFNADGSPVLMKLPSLMMRENMSTPRMRSTDEDL